jgi:hypothetical protein
MLIVGPPTQSLPLSKGEIDTEEGEQHETKNPEDKSGVEMPQLFSSNWSLRGVNKETQKVKWKGSETRTSKETYQAKTITPHTLTHTQTKRRQ